MAIKNKLFDNNRNITSKKDQTTTYDWFVSNPINNYGVNINIGDYVGFSSKFDGSLINSPKICLETFFKTLFFTFNSIYKLTIKDYCL